MRVPDACTDLARAAGSPGPDTQSFIPSLPFAESKQHWVADRIVSGGGKRSGTVQVPCHGERVLHILAHRQAAERQLRGHQGGQRGAQRCGQGLHDLRAGAAPK